MSNLFSRLSSFAHGIIDTSENMPDPASSRTLKPLAEDVPQGAPRFFSQVNLDLPRNHAGRSRFRRRLNKLCDVSDWRGREWKTLLSEVGQGVGARKAWEWTHGLYGLRQLGFLNEHATALGVGAGTEAVLYYMANNIKQVIATDIYGIGNFVNHEATESMLEHPDTFAPFPYRKDRLLTQYMDGRKLEYHDNAFDVVFSFSSIEHFGGHAAAAQSMQEIGRVLQPGGAAVIATELILNGKPHDEYFLPNEIDEYLVRPSGLHLFEDIDFTFSRAMQKCPIVDLGAPDWINTNPHIFCHLKGMVWTSLLIFLEKPTVKTP